MRSSGSSGSRVANGPSWKPFPSCGAETDGILKGASPFDPRGLSSDPPRGPRALLMPFSSANTFLIGAQRSGTTNLAHLLGFHPEISLSEPKEPVFYARNWHKGFEWYAERFAHKDRPGHTRRIDVVQRSADGPVPREPGKADDAFDDIPAKIHDAAPEARFIYVVRDPVPRTNSLYWLLRHDDPGYRRFGSLRHAIETDPFMLRGSDYIGQIDNLSRALPGGSIPGARLRRGRAGHPGGPRRGVSVSSGSIRTRTRHRGGRSETSRTATRGSESSSARCVWGARISTASDFGSNESGASEGVSTKASSRRFRP